MTKTGTNGNLVISDIVTLQTLNLCNILVYHVFCFNICSNSVIFCISFQFTTPTSSLLRLTYSCIENISSVRYDTQLLAKIFPFYYFYHPVRYITHLSAIIKRTIALRKQTRNDFVFIIFSLLLLLLHYIVCCYIYQTESERFLLQFRFKNNYT